MVDAILKEKCVSFMPNYVTLVPMIKGLLSLNTARSLREYLGINYDTDCDAELINRRKSSPSEEYFSTSSMIWWFVASSVLVFIFAGGSVLEATLGCNCWIIYTVFSVLSFVHMIEAIYALHLCDELRFRFEFHLFRVKHHFCFEHFDMMYLCNFEYCNIYRRRFPSLPAPTEICDSKISVYFGTIEGTQHFVEEETFR
ncbi:hypothetical protein Y032_0514g2768 [Ancylostoma ceylanicum]|nr:hypothetical protein Y032_0514g2768 [Ancylostoma ceylanicum]